MEFITDRTPADVARAKTLAAKGWAGMTAAEQAEWSAGQKGAYNYTDLNRVESGVAALAAKLHITLQTKTDWLPTDAPTNADMERYLANIRALREARGALLSAPQPPASMAGLDWAGANAIEQTLADLDRLLQVCFYAGEAFCGEV